MDVTERTVVRNPLSDDPNAGVIIAPGDPLPGFAGLVQNTPNKVDAAANYDDVDAADKAGAGARPATTVVSGSALSPEAAAARQEIHDRVAENRDAWAQDSRALSEQAASPGDAPPELSDAAKVTGPPSTDDTSGAAPGDMTVAELDTKYGDADGYPKSGNKAEKVAFVKAQGA